MKFQTFLDGCVTNSAVALQEIPVSSEAGHIKTFRGKFFVRLIGLAMCVAMTNNSQAGIFDLQPTAGNLTVSYQHTYDHTDTTGDPNVVLRKTSPLHSGSGTTEAFFYAVSTSGGNQVGHVIYNFTFTPPPDKPNALVTGISVTSHSNDFGSGFANGTFWTDAMSTPVEFFNTATDGNAVVTKNLGDFASVGGARSVQLVYTADLGGQTNFFLQQLLGAHDQATPSWTFDVTPTWEDSSVAYTPITVANHSFENENLAGDDQWAPFHQPLDNASWTYHPTSNFQVLDPSGSRFAGAAGNDGNNQNVLPDGGQILNLAGGPGVSQIVGTTEDFTEYLLSFWIGTTADSPFDVPGTFSAQLLDDGVPFAVLSAGAPLPGTFKEFTLIGTTGASVSGDLSLQFVNTGGTVWLDNVQLFSRELAVPEPTSVTMWLIAGFTTVLSALALQRRRSIKTA